MENILNRNVHPLYAVMAFFAAAVVVVLYINIVRRRKGEKQIYLNFFTFIIFFCIQDGIWGLLASGIIQSDLWLMIASSVFHISSALAPLVWTVFFCSSLMDIQMPVMDGYEATKAIRALPDGDKVTIIALSANAFEEDVKKSLECGMNGHSAKPIDVKVLFEIMKNLSQE